MTRPRRKLRATATAASPTKVQHFNYRTTRRGLESWGVQEVAIFPQQN